MLSELVAQLNGLPDARRGAGKRHPVGVVLVVAIMSVLSGMWSYRAMGDFVKANKEELCRLLHVSRLPSYSTIGRTIKEVSFEHLSQILGHWKRADLETSGLLNWLQLDGKAQKGTVARYGENNQDFINVVSMFFGQKKAVLQSAFFHNKQESEIKVVRKMIRQTDIKGVVFTADALHTQKKRSGLS